HGSFLGGERSPQPRRNGGGQYALGLQQVASLDFQSAIGPQDSAILCPDQLSVYANLAFGSSDGTDQNCFGLQAPAGIRGTGARRTHTIGGFWGYQPE